MTAEWMLVLAKIWAKAITLGDGSTTGASHVAACDPCRADKVGYSPNSNMLTMPPNRQCKKCGYLHAVGMECPGPNAVFGAVTPEEREK
jgi:hypothetical protein